MPLDLTHVGGSGYLPTAPISWPGFRNPAAVTALTTFAWLWAAGTLFDFESHSPAFRVASVAVCVAALLVLYRPTALWPFLTLLAIQAVAIFRALPNVANHRVLILAGGLTILAAASRLVWSNRTWKISADALYAAAAPVLRVELVILYFFVTFHKLNSGYWNLDYGCAAVIYARVADAYPVFPAAAWARAIATYSSVIVEATIPIMLLVRRLRVAGLIVGLVFHFALTLDPRHMFYNFTGVLFPFYVLFAPTNSLESLSKMLAHIQARWHRLRGSRAMWLLARAALYVVGPAVILIVIFRESTLPGVTRHLGPYIWFIFAPALLVVFFTTLHRQPSGLPNARRLVAVPVSSPLWIFPILLVANGLMPYLGGKTETSFAMFTNLRTEGGVTNHWLMPVSWQLWDYQRDLVRVHTISVPYLQDQVDQGWQWPYFEFRAMMRRFPNASVTYERAGQVTTVQRARDNPDLMQSDFALLRRVFSFRRVPVDHRAAACIH